MGLIISIIRHTQKYITNSKMLYLFSIQGLTFQYKKNYSKKSEKYFKFGFFIIKILLPYTNVQLCNTIRQDIRLLNFLRKLDFYKFPTEIDSEICKKIIISILP